MAHMAFKFVFRNANGQTTLTQAMEGESAQAAFNRTTAFVKANAVTNEKGEVATYRVETHADMARTFNPYF